MFSYTYTGHGPAVFPHLPNDHGGGLEAEPGDTVESEVLLHHGHLVPADAVTAKAHADEVPFVSGGDVPAGQQVQLGQGEEIVPADVAAARLAGRNL
jgi:hypothetical protein